MDHRDRTYLGISVGNAGLEKEKKFKNIIFISIMVFMVNLVGANWRVAALPSPAPRSCWPCIQPGLTWDVGLPSTLLVRVD